MTESCPQKDTSPLRYSIQMNMAISEHYIMLYNIILCSLIATFFECYLI